MNSPDHQSGAIGRSAIPPLNVTVLGGTQLRVISLGADATTHQATFLDYAPRPPFRIRPWLSTQIKDCWRMFPKRTPSTYLPRSPL